jgi:hypothetical protein
MTPSNALTERLRAALDRDDAIVLLRERPRRRAAPHSSYDCRRRAIKSAVQQLSSCDGISKAQGSVPGL